MKKYSKAIIAISGFLATLAQVTADGAVDSAEAGLLVTALFTAIGVFQIRNKPAAPPDSPVA